MCWRLCQYAGHRVRQLHDLEKEVEKRTTQGNCNVAGSACRNLEDLKKFEVRACRRFSQSDLEISSACKSSCPPCEVDLLDRQAGQARESQSVVCRRPCSCSFQTGRSQSDKTHLFERSVSPETSIISRRQSWTLPRHCPKPRNSSSSLTLTGLSQTKTLTDGSTRRCVLACAGR